MTRILALLALAALAGCTMPDRREVGRGWIGSHCDAAGGCEEICRDAPGSDAARRHCP